MKQTKTTKRAAAQLGQMAALTNQVRQLTALAAAAGNARPSVVRKRNKRAMPKAPKMAGIPSSVRSRVAQRGMADIKGHVIRWTLGYVYIGDGVHGTIDNVLFQTSDLKIFASNAGNGLVPVLAGDTILGKTYVRDVQKHFGRKVIRKLVMYLDGLVPSTGTAAMIAFAPLRGASQVGLSATVPSPTPGAPGVNLDTVLSLNGSDVIDTFEHRSYDLTRFIAGGFGPAQNEFNVSANFTGPGACPSTVLVAGATLINTTGIDLISVVPMTLLFSGKNSQASLRGQQVFEVVIEQVVDLLDYTGGLSDPVNII